LRKGSLLILAAGLAAYLLYIFLYVGFGNIYYLLLKLDPRFFLLSILFLIASIVLHGFAWYLLLGGSFGRGYRAVAATVIGLFASYMIPVGAVSEVIRFYIVTRFLGFGVVKAISSIFIHRVCITVSPIVAIAALLLYSGGSVPAMERMAFATIIVVYISAIVSPNIIALGFIGTGIFERLVRRFEGYIERILGQRLGDLRGEYRSSMGEMLRSWRGLAAFIASLAEWIFLVLSMYSIFMALELRRDLVYAVFSILLIQILWWILPISFGGSIGITDLIASIAYQILGFGTGVSATIALLYRLSSLTALLVLLYPSIKILGLYPGEFRRYMSSSKY